MTSSVGGLRPGLSRLKLQLRRPHVAVSLILLAILIVIVVVPIVKMVLDSVVWHYTDSRLSRAARPGALTLFHWRRVFASSLTRNVLVQPLINSLTTSLAVSALAMLIGSLLAWLVTRTDLPGRGVIASAAVVPYVIPSFIHALAWLTLFKNERIGGASGLFQYLFHASPPDWLSYGFVPIVITLSIHYFPYTFLLVSAALASLDSSLEESGEILGARRSTIMGRITFPLVLPALLSSFILTFSRALGIFATPYFLGSPVRFFTLTTQIYSSITNRIPATAYILALTLIVISSTLVFINQKVIGTRRSFVTIAGKGFRSAATPLRALRYPLLAMVAALMLFAVLMPLVLMIWQTLTRYSDDFSLHRLTLLFWIGEGDPQIADGEVGILRNPAILRAAWNSVRLALIASVGSGLMGIFIGYAVVKGRGTNLSRTVEQISFLPYLVPGIAFGALYLALFTRSYGPIPALYGTFFLLILVCIAKNLPFSARAGVSSMMQIGSELEEASEVVGARWPRRFGRIIFPLSLRSALSGFLLVFITVMRELALIILLVSPENRTLTTMTFRYQEQGYTQFSSAISVLIIVIVLVGHAATRRLGLKGEEQ